MKKVLSVLLAMVLAFGGLFALPISAADPVVPAENYTFIDLATNGRGTFVAMAKAADLAYAMLYYSNDGGLTWQPSSNQPQGIRYGTFISANRKSQQQLVWWEEKKLFIAKGSGNANSDGNNTYTSPDGVTWSVNKAVNWSGAAMLTVSGEHLVMGANKKARATNDATAASMSSTVYDVPTTNSDYYLKTIAAKPANADGSVDVFVNGCNEAYDLRFSVTGGTYSWSQVAKNSGNTTQEPYDMVYAAGADQFLSVDGSETLIAATNSQSVSKLTIKEGVNVTGVNASERYIVLGMGDGSMYYTENAPVTAETVWTEIPPQAGSTAASEPIKNIAFSNDSHFVALGSTQIYRGSISNYCNIKEYVEIGDPTLSAQNVFDGVRLIGGTYSQTLGKYIVYGDTTTPDAQDRYWGKIFTSTDGLSWKAAERNPGYTFSRRNTKDGQITGYVERRNGAVWWENQQQFIISASTSEHTGVSLVSTDGENWTAVTTDVTGLRTDVDLAIGGGALYMPSAGRALYKYTAWNQDSRTLMADFSVDNYMADTWAMNQIAVSDEADPAILVGQNGNGAIRDNQSTADTELGKWHTNGGLGGAGNLTDSVYSTSLNKFVAVFTTGLRTSIVSKDGTVVQGPSVPNQGVCNAIDTNGEVFLFAGKKDDAHDGALYTAPDSIDFPTSSLTKVPAAASVEEENTMNVTNVFRAGDKFIATASDNTNSDVLLVSKNTEGAYEYVKASESTKVEGLTPGKTVAVNLNCINKTGADYTFDLIAAVYADGQLIQAQSGSMTVPAGTSPKLSMPVTLASNLPQNAEMKLYMWDSLSSMIPLKEPVSPF